MNRNRWWLLAAAPLLALVVVGSASAAAEPDLWVTRADGTPVADRPSFGGTLLAPGGAVSDVIVLHRSRAFDGRVDIRAVPRSPVTALEGDLRLAVEAGGTTTTADMGDVLRRDRRLPVTAAFVDDALPVTMTVSMDPGSPNLTQRSEVRFDLVLTAMGTEIPIGPGPAPDASPPADEPGHPSPASGPLAITGAALGAAALLGLLLVGGGLLVILGRRRDRAERTPPGPAAQLHTSERTDGRSTVADLWPAASRSS